MDRCAVVVGGGISGLFAAWLLKQRQPEASVVVLESEAECGGLLRSFNYGDHGRFDYGVHTLYETGVARIDEAILGTLPDEDWSFHYGREKDLGASWLDGRLQFDTPYPVLSDRPDADELIADFIRSLGTSPVAACDDALGELSRLYGTKIAERLLIPAIEARQHLPAEQIHRLALQVYGIGRIAALPLETVLRLAELKGFNSRIAFPDQRKSPFHLISDKKVFYPKAGHLSHFTDQFVDRVRKLGVTIVNGANLRSIDASKGQITKISFEHPEIGYESVDVSVLCWCAGIPSIARMLGLGAFLSDMVRPPTTVICNMLVDQMPNSGGVYYGYFHGKPVAHRFSFPANVSGVTRSDGLWPIALELIYPAGSDTQNAVATCEEAFRSTGIIQPETKVVFAKAETLKSGYPSLSTKNISALRMTRDAIVDLGISNLMLFGPLVRDDLFFQFDVLRHVEETIGG